MSTSNTHQQSLADAGSETRPLMLERGPYKFKEFTLSETEPPRMQKEEDLKGDDLKHYEAEIEAMNLILISIPNDIYNSMDACTTAQAMWQRVERLMRGTVQNKVDRETHFNNEFDQFVAEPGEALVSFEKLINASKEKKLEKSHDPLTLVAHTGSSSRTTSSYYVTHPSLVVDYDEDYQGGAVQNTSEDPLTSAMICLLVVQIQSRNSGNDGRNTRCSYVQEEVIEGTNVQNDAGNIQRTLQTTSSGTAANVQCYNCSEKGVIITDEQNHFLFSNASWMEEIEELSANICLMATIQPANFDSDEGPSYDSAFLNEQRDKLELSVIELKRQTMELQKTRSILKRKMSENEDKYHDTVLDLKISKLYDAFFLDDSKIHVNVRDTEDILDDATKSQVKMKQKSQDPISIEKKTKCLDN
ncbi:hypothetical protein Tco_0722340 [Tanacetum coccineum]